MGDQGESKANKPETWRENFRFDYTPEERRATYSAAVVDLDEEDDG